MRNIFTLLCFLSFALSVIAQEISSPDTNFLLQFELQKGIPTYQLLYKNQSVM